MIGGDYRLDPFINELRPQGRKRLMPFGKFRGWALDEIPTWYVEWLATLDDLREPLKGAVNKELERRRP